MRKVWKYRIPWGDDVTIEMPDGAEILDAQPQGIYGDISLWALVDPDVPTTQRRFKVVGTGHPVDDDVTVYNVAHISTMQFQDGAYVFHLFEINCEYQMARYVGIGGAMGEDGRDAWDAN